MVRLSSLQVPSHGTFTDLFMWDVKEPIPMFEKSRGCSPRWCGQPLRVVVLGTGMAPCMGPMSPVRAHSLWAGLCPEKPVK